MSAGKIILEVVLMITEIKKHRGNPNWGISKSYNEVRDIIKPLNFKTMKEYRDWVEAHKPEGFPLTPYATYSRRNEWVSTPHFLGKMDLKHKEDEGITQRFSFKSLKTIIRQLMGMG